MDRTPAHRPPPTVDDPRPPVERAYISDKKEGAELPIVRGDALFAKSGIERVDLIKIDIEGYEKNALKGLRQTLAKSRPVLLVELTIDPTVPDFFASEREIRAHFPEGYDFRLLAGKTHQGRIEGVYRLDPFALSFNAAKQVDLVAFPREKRAAVARARR